MHGSTRFAHGKIQTWRQDILNLVTLGKGSSYSYNRNGGSSLQASPSHSNAWGLRLCLNHENNGTVGW